MRYDRKKQTVKGGKSMPMSWGSSLTKGEDLLSETKTYGKES